MTEKELKFIREAYEKLENPNLLSRIANSIGKPIEFLHESLPEKAQKNISALVKKSLAKALEVAIGTTRESVFDGDFNAAIKLGSTDSKLHTAGAATAGGIAGFFGPAALVLELPITTTIMLRSIAEQASSFGFSLSSGNEIKLECLTIFNYGSNRSKGDDQMESAYFSTREAFNVLIKNAVGFVSTHSAKEVLRAIEKGTAPELVKLIGRIAATFEVAVTEKLVAESIPVLGAAGGALINGAFCDHFSKVAHYHFGLRRLEETYGKDAVHSAYLGFRDKNAA